jgi:hypothetical protein
MATSDIYAHSLSSWEKGETISRNIYEQFVKVMSTLCHSALAQMRTLPQKSYIFFMKYERHVRAN